MEHSNAFSIFGVILGRFPKRNFNKEPHICTSIATKSTTYIELKLINNTLLERLKLFLC